jgi:hypothetical protein
MLMLLLLHIDSDTAQTLGYQTPTVTVCSVCQQLIEPGGEAA